MGKIVDALRVARGEVPELVLHSIEELEIVEANGQPAMATAPPVAPVGRILPVPRPAPEEPQAATVAAAAGGATEGATARAPRVEPVVGRWRIQPLPFPVPDAGPVLSASLAHPNAAEQYGFVRTRIMHHPSAPATVAVSSPGIGDGKSVTSINVAGAFAQSEDEEVLLIDGDLRCSSVHEYLRVPKSPGLGEVLAGKCSLQDAIFRVGQVPSLCVLPAGASDANPTGLLGSSRWPALVKTLRQHFHRVIIDCPPAEAVADYDLIAAACDAVLVVVRLDHTDRALCARAIEKTRKKLLGVLLNCASDRARLAHYRGRYSYRREERKA